MSESAMIENYPTFVEHMNMMRTKLEDFANTSLSEVQRRVVMAADRFYDVFEEIGLLNLS